MTIVPWRAGEFYDETTGEKLDEEFVEACQEEMKYLESLGVYKTIPHEQAAEQMERRPVGIKWVDVKTAYSRHRRRLVAREFND